VSRSKTSATQAAKRAELTHKALELKKAGLSYRSIAERLDIPSSTAHKYVKRALEEANKQNLASATSLRSLQHLRLEELLKASYAKAIKGDLHSIDRCTRIIDSITKLTGADAPTKIAQTNIEGDKTVEQRVSGLTEAEVDARIAELEQKLSK